MKNNKYNQRHLTEEEINDSELHQPSDRETCI